ncbi:MAG: BatD family protein [Ostreibacterium sp.]
MNINKKTVIFLLGLLFVWQSFAIGLTARLNTPTVVEGDTFRLTLSTKENTPTPDLAPLKTDFTIVGTAQSTSISNINGKMTRSNSWIISLSPKKVGRLSIPKIHAGKVSSKALSINVVDTAHAPKSTGASQGINLVVRLNGYGDKFYQFQEIPLTVRVETDKNFLQASLLSPESSDFELTPHGQDRNSKLTQKGRVINVIERDYLLRPQVSGKLTLLPFTLQGAMPDNNRQTPFDTLFGQSPGMMQRGKAFVKRSNSLTIAVSANPNASTGEWFLPAKKVALQAQWQPKNPTFKQGQSVTRKIRLLALGARAEQLPKLSFHNVDGAKIYLDDDRTDMKDTPNGTQALREMTLSIIPTRGGQVALPKIMVKWLNTNTGKTETAVLPEQTIEVIGHLPIAKKKVTKSNTLIPKTTNQNPPKIMAPTFWMHNKMIAVAIIIGLVLVVAILFMLFYRQRKTVVEPERDVTKKPVSWSMDNRKQPNNTTKKLKTEIDDALKKQDIKQLYQVLLQWQHQDFSAKQSSVINETKSTLEKILYQEKTLDMIDFNSLTKVLSDEWVRLAKKVKMAEKSTVKSTVLPPLYPNL